MHFGIVAQTTIESGGAHSYELGFVKTLSEAAVQAGHSVTVFSPDLQFSSVLQVNKVRFSATRAQMLVAHLRSNFVVNQFLRLLGLGQSKLERLAKKNKVDCLVFASPNHVSMGIHLLPMATTVWDLGHLDLPQATETSLGGLWFWRQNLFERTLPRSFAIFADSDSTVRRVTQVFGVPSKHVWKIGLLPEVQDVDEIKFERPHFIYPAKFWPHKNHQTLIYAFRELLDNQGDKPLLVFTGEGPNFNYVKSLVSGMGLEDDILFLGRVDRIELLGLIRGSVGLLMPSLLGPSNLPPIEASLLGVPVVMSDVHDMEDLLSGVREVSTLDFSAWAKAMEELLRGEIRPGRVAELDVEGKIQNFISQSVKTLVALGLAK